MTKVKGHFKKVRMITELPNKAYSKHITTWPQKTHLDTGSDWVEVTLQNHSGREVKAKAKTIIGKIVAANVVPLMLTPKKILIKGDVQKEPQGAKEVRCAKTEVGDLVLIRQKAFKGKNKIVDEWENTPYIVKEQILGLPVYKVEKKMRTVK